MRKKIASPTERSGKTSLLEAKARGNQAKIYTSKFSNALLKQFATKQRFLLLNMEINLILSVRIASMSVLR